MTAEAIARALDPKATRSGKNWVLRCPCHDDRTASLSLADGRDGRLLVKCFAGCDARAILDHMRAKGWIEDARPARGRRRGRRNDGNPPRRWPTHGAPEDDGEARRQAALALWRATRPAPGTLVDLYLEARGLAHAIPPAIRFHPRLWHAPSQRHWPAMVSKVEDVTGAFLGVHRTWLASDWSPAPVTKASVERAKKMLGPCAGGAVRLAEPVNDRLIVGEGIESTLSAMELAGGWPAWAALSTSGMKALVLPACVTDVLIAADHDANGAGLDAAGNAARRWRAEGRRVAVRMAGDQGTDFNDVARGGA